MKFSFLRSFRMQEGLEEQRYKDSGDGFEVGGQEGMKRKNAQKEDA